MIAIHIVFPVHACIKLQEMNDAFDNEVRRLLNTCTCTCARIRTDCVVFRTGGGGGGGGGPALTSLYKSPRPHPLSPPVTAELLQFSYWCSLHTSNQNRKPSRQGSSHMDQCCSKKWSRPT